VVDELDVGAGAALVQRHPQGVKDEGGAHVAGELPAHDPARERVDDEREEQHAFPAAQVGQVRHPELVRPSRGEVAVDQVRPPARPRIGRGGAPRLAAALGAADPVGAHQPLDAATADWFADPPQRLAHAPRSVGVGVGRVKLADPVQQPLVLDRSARASAGLAVVIGGRRHVQGPADRLDPEATAVPVDIAAHFGRSGSSSLAKNTLADFRISFARRSS
jgi:hypothetical protein